MEICKYDLAPAFEISCIPIKIFKSHIHNRTYASKMCCRW
jgi:hypothetical protein